MDRTQALYNFWSSFGLPAYDEQTLPDDAKMPYIAYETEVGDIYAKIPLTASIYYKSYSWAEITAKMEQISEAIGQGGTKVPFEDGTLWIKREENFASRIAEPNDDSVRRYYLKIVVEYHTAK